MTGCGACAAGWGRAARDTYHRGFEYHHGQPRSAGGADGAENLVLLCHACHLAMHGKAPAEAPPAGSVPKTLTCKACGADNDPRTVTMNCGWYQCRQCDRQTHLFDHFGFIP